MMPPPLTHHVIANVAMALAEDLCPESIICDSKSVTIAQPASVSLDITATLLPSTSVRQARAITREPAILCGQAWVNETARQVDSQIQIDWHTQDGDALVADQALFTATGSARSLLTFERVALNFLQLLSGTATISAQYAGYVAHTSVTLLDTRKTIPGLRQGQKYAVACGGCANHRLGLYDAFLIKENHIQACGDIAKAVQSARKTHANKPLEIEVETITELQQALDVGVDIVMLDNFDLNSMREAVQLNKQAGAKQARIKPAKLEASGGITLDTLVSVAETGVDYISIGALTKDCRAIDLSMRLIE